MNSVQEARESRQGNYHSIMCGLCSYPRRPQCSAEFNSQTPFPAQHPAPLKIYTSLAPSVHNSQDETHRISYDPALVMYLTHAVAAVALGATSAPGPLQVFHGTPSSGIMATLPWILIPCFLVPALAFLHLCTFYRLRTMQAAERTKNLSPMRVATLCLSFLAF